MKKKTPVSFEQEIKQLSEPNSPPVLRIKKNGQYWQLLKMPQGADHPFYVFREKAFLGQGQYGAVYRGYSVSAAGRVDFDKQPWAVKKTSVQPYLNEFIRQNLGYYNEARAIDSSNNDSSEAATRLFLQKGADQLRDLVTQEIEHLRTVYTAEPDLYFIPSKAVQEVDHELEPAHYLVSTYVPGKQLISDDNAMHPDVKKLSLTQRLELIVLILQQLQAIHEKEIVHRDIKGSNILVEVEKEFRAGIIDFGFATKPNSEESKRIFGSPGHMAPEISLEQGAQLESDIYSLVPVIAMLLGATSPFEEKDEFKKQVRNSNFRNAFKQLAESHYVIDDILGNRLYHKRYPPEVKSLAIEFLNRMQNKDTKNRPHSKQIIQFFTALKNICVGCDGKNPEWARAQAVDLAIIANGIDSKSNPELIRAMNQLVATRGLLTQENVTKLKETEKDKLPELAHQILVAHFRQRYMAHCFFGWLLKVGITWGRTEFGAKVAANKGEISASSIKTHIDLQSSKSRSARSAARRSYEEMKDSFEKLGVQATSHASLTR